MSGLLVSTIAGLVAAVLVFASPPSAGAGTGTPTEDWVRVQACEACQCADGSEVCFFERIADSARVVLYFEGGGACFDADSCAFAGPETTYIPSLIVEPEDLARRGGIFDLDRAENPFAGYSFLYVPYCTGDAHLGDASTAYSDDLVVRHKGFVNASAALDHVVERFPEIEQLVVAGISAGAIPVPLVAGLASDRLPHARIVSLADGAGAFPDLPVLNAIVGERWGTAAAIPEWPETQGLGLDHWGIPKLTVYAGRHAPAATFARFDFAEDATQAFYASLVGLQVDEVLALIEGNEADIEAAGVEVASYVAPGDAHTILGSEAFYELDVDGVRFVDWVDALQSGLTPPDVRCGDCRG